MEPFPPAAEPERQGPATSTRTWTAHLSTWASRLAQEIRSLLLVAVRSLRMTLVLVVLSGVLFPLLVYGIAQAAFPAQANGSLVKNARGQVVGSSLIGQQFTQPAYFHGRPSAVGYNAAGSGSSAIGPTNPQLISRVGSYAAQFRKENGLAPDTPLPPDIVTASGSGLDPDVSVQAAYLQVNRVLAARKALGGKNETLTAQRLMGLIDTHTDSRDLGFMGEPRVNVLDLNLALDALYGPPTQQTALGGQK